jgi:hypothetical protein
VPAQDILDGFVTGPAHRPNNNDEIVRVLTRLVELLGGRENVVAIQNLGNASFEVSFRIQVCWPFAVLCRAAFDDSS